MHLLGTPTWPGGGYPDASETGAVTWTVPMYQLSLSLVNSSATPPRLLGVVGTNYPLTRTDAALASLSGMNNDTYLGMLLNDTVITMWGGRPSFQHFCRVC